MFDLYEKLTDLDKQRISNYIHLYGAKDYTLDLKEYLAYWNQNNKKLYKLLGENLILKVPITFEVNSHEFELRLKKSEEYNNFFDRLWRLIYPRFINERVSEFYREISAPSNIIANKIPSTYIFNFINNRKPLKIQEGMRVIAAIQKFLSYIDEKDNQNFKSVQEKFEKFRIFLSVITNKKCLDDTLYLSIHPLDFMTMSDNTNRWQSCMSWTHDGCYKIGTVEMMNSNNVICCYLESQKPYNFDKNNKTEEREDFTWNNKRWRTLIYSTKEILLSGKSYPYENKELTEKILNIVKDLSEKNLKRTYQFGPESYKDMKHINYLSAVDSNKMWRKNDNCKKKNIIFDSDGMYNDIMNNSNYSFICYRNKVKKNLILNMSGKAPCLCCGDPVIEKDIPQDWTDEDPNRYQNTNNLVCGECLNKYFTCEICGTQDSTNTIKKSAIVRKNGIYLTDDIVYSASRKKTKVEEHNFCSDCYTDLCNCCNCGNSFYFKANPCYIRINEEELSYTKIRNDKRNNKIMYSSLTTKNELKESFNCITTICIDNICPNCLLELIDNDTIYLLKSTNYFDKSILLSTKIYSYEEFINDFGKYLKKEEEK